MGGGTEAQLAARTTESVSACESSSHIGCASRVVHDAAQRNSALPEEFLVLFVTDISIANSISCIALVELFRNSRL